MPDIVLTTLNARYAHASFGLRYLRANLGPLFDRSTILEFDVSHRPIDMVDAILSQGPRIVGVGVYIWNAVESLRLVRDLKRLAPDVIVVLGGPEVSYETDQQEVCRLADFIVTGEADFAFRDLCEKLLAGSRPLMRIIPAELPEFGARAGTAAGRFLSLPYHLYSQTDIAHRVIYVEASRGCPFKCEFCLSSLDVPVRNVPIDPFLASMQDLLDRGVRQFKFVDRTFNLNLNVGRAILQFFLDRLDRYPELLFLHFELIPDRLPEGLRELIRRFPAGTLQFEVGIQTFNPEIGDRISRRQDNAKVEENLRWLRAETRVHVHADLIVGLPGEDLASFGRGFDKLLALGPQEIQVGILKRLRGTPITRHDAAWGMVYSDNPPYEVLRTGAMDFATIQRLRRFSRYWDLIANSGNFIATAPMIWAETNAELETLIAERTPRSAFASFLALSDSLFASTRQTHAIALTNLAELLFNFLTIERHVEPKRVATAIWSDFQRLGRSDRPAFLKGFAPPADTRTIRKPGTKAPSRQARHLAM